MAYAPPCSARPSARTASSRSPTTVTRSTTSSATASPVRRRVRVSTSSAPPGGSSRPPARRSTVASAHSERSYGRGIKTGKPTQALLARPGRGSKITAEIARYLGAISIVVVGVIHAQQYYYAYFNVVPTIGTLFLLSFVGAGVVGAT